MDFDLDVDEANFYFGQPDEWEGPTPSPLATAPMVDRTASRRQLEDLLKQLSPEDIARRIGARSNTRDTATVDANH